MCNRSVDLYTPPSILYLYQNNLHQSHLDLDRNALEERRRINLNATTVPFVLDLSRSALYQRRMLALAQRRAQAQAQVQTQTR